jgi:alginate O-acetyltransferase complex protein AlgI
LAKRLRLPHALTRAALIPCVFLLTSFAWIFFRAQTFGDAWTVIRRIASMESFTFAATPQQFEVVKGMVLIGVLVAIEATSFFVDLPRLADRRLWLNGVFIVLCLITLSLLGTFTGATFIYAQF